MLPPVLFEAVTSVEKHSVLCELLHVDDLVLMSEIIEGLMNKNRKLKKAFERKCIKFNVEKQKLWLVEEE